MMGKCRIIAILLFGFLVIGVSGCNTATTNDPSTDTSYTAGGDTMLNDRQVEILSEQALPTEYDKLDKSQQEAIVAIEELLQHLEEKHKTDFSYLGYNTASVLENETLTAYPSAGDKLLDIVTVTRNGETISDDYANVVVKPIYNGILEEFFKKTFDERDFKIFSTINTSRIETSPVAAADISGNVGASNDIFFDSAYVSDATFDQFVNEYAEWMKANKYYGSNQFVLLTNGTLKYLSEYNYVDYFEDNQHTRRVYCDINNDGTTKVWE